MINRLTEPTRRSALQTIVVVLCINASSALAVVVLNWLMTEGMTSAQFTRGLTTSLVYANCCGSIMAIVMPRVAPVYAHLKFPISWVCYIGTVLVLSVIGCLISVLLLTGIGILHPADYWTIFRSSLVVAIVISMVIGISRYCYEGVKYRLEVTTRRLQLKELEEERSRKLAVEARLSSLESRIHPHFLFNTLNSISSLIQEDPSLAERLVERLATLLRFSLDSDQTSVVPLSRELKVVIDYLEIERARFGDKLRYSNDLPVELVTVDVPPLSIQTLVENSVRHAVAARRDGGEIRIRAIAKGDRVSIEVSDDGPGFSADAIKTGHGLDNLQARLAVLFDDRASLELSSDKGWTTVSISVPRTTTAEVARV